jgi:hypothetical protein
MLVISDKRGFHYKYEIDKANIKLLFLITHALSLQLSVKNKLQALQSEDKTKSKFEMVSIFKYTVDAKVDNVMGVWTVISTTVEDNI